MSAPANDLHLTAEQLAAARAVLKLARELALDPRIAEFDEPARVLLFMNAALETLMHWAPHKSFEDCRQVMASCLLGLRPPDDLTREN